MEISQTKHIEITLVWPPYSALAICIYWLGRDLLIRPGILLMVFIEWDYKYWFYSWKHFNPLEFNTFCKSMKSIIMLIIIDNIDLCRPSLSMGPWWIRAVPKIFPMKGISVPTLAIVSEWDWEMGLPKYNFVKWTLGWSCYTFWKFNTGMATILSNN